MSRNSINQLAALGALFLFSTITASANCGRGCVVIYDPIQDTWEKGPSLPNRLHMHYDGVAILPSGDLFLMGKEFTAIYSPALRKWRMLPDAKKSDYDISLVGLTDGKVLLSGGLKYVNGHYIPTNRSEIYDSTTDTWEDTAERMHANHYKHRPVRLKDGRVLFYGGKPEQNSVEIFDEITHHWESYPAPLPIGFYQSIVVLQDGSVLIVGGTDGDIDAPRLKTGAIFNPVTHVWKLIADMPIARSDAESHLLHDGRVLVAGGLSSAGNFGAFRETKKAHIYDPFTDSWSETGDLSAPRSVRGGVLNDSAENAIMFGNGCHDERHAEIYDEATKKWHLSTRGPHFLDTASISVLPDGRYIGISYGGFCN
jgi:hypothetical protein